MPARYVEINGGFEDGLEGWAVQHLYGDSPTVNIESLANGADPRAVLAGDKSLRLIQEDHAAAWGSVIFRKVKVAPDSWLSFEASAMFKAGHRSGLDENLIRDLHSTFRVGIDPLGGVDPEAEGVLWRQTSGDHMWNTLLTSAEHPGHGEYVTLFVTVGIGDPGAGGWAYPWSMVFLDGLTLVESTEGDEPPPPPVDAPLLEIPVRVRGRRKRVVIHLLDDE